MGTNRPSGGPAPARVVAEASITPTIRVAAVAPLVPAWRVDRTFDYLVPDALAERVAAGSLVRVVFGNRRVRGIVMDVVEGDAGAELSEILGLVTEHPVATGPTLDLALWIAARYVAPRGRVLERLVPPRVRALASDPVPVAVPQSSGALTSFTGGGELEAAVAAGSDGVWCLRTLPGSDRADVVGELLALSPARERGSALLVVPEADPETGVLQAVSERFPGLARVDTGRSEGDRSAAWLRLTRGQRMGAGSRAAVLAPARELRTIVVDDEHNPGYKEDRAPRYDARRVAVRRAALEGATCVLVSPCPSVETGWAVLSGAFDVAQPPRAAERARRPLVELIEPEARNVLSHALQRRIKGALEAGQRVGLLVPSPGFARAVWCAQCRRTLRCPRCETGLSLDRAPERVRCPRCGFTQPPPEACPSCGASDFAYVGWGSERLAEQLSKAFPRASVARMDPSLSEDPGHDRIRHADIYVTTWLGTKPSIRPPVSFVGVVDGDWLIRRADFRAAERAYQALVEMAGWAGAATDGGRLVVQTAEPTHYVLQAIARADYGFFLRHELEQRRELSYPPFTELVGASAEGAAGRDVLERIAARARPLAVQVLGPVPMARPNANRFEILIKTGDAETVADQVRDILAAAGQNARVRVDVDPR